MNGWTPPENSTYSCCTAPHAVGNRLDGDLEVQHIQMFHCENAELGWLDAALGWLYAPCLGWLYAPCLGWLHDLDRGGPWLCGPCWAMHTLTAQVAPWKVVFNKPNI